MLFSWFLVKNIGKPPYKYHETCDWLKKSIWKLEDFNVKWKSWHLKYFKSKKFGLGKFEYIILLNSSFDVGLFFNFNFEITMTYFLNPHFIFYMRERCNINISKVHYRFILFFPYDFFNMIPIKIYCNMDN